MSDFLVFALSEIDPGPFAVERIEGWKIEAPDGLAAARLLRKREPQQREGTLAVLPASRAQLIAPGGRTAPRPGEVDLHDDARDAAEREAWEEAEREFDRVHRLDEPRFLRLGAVHPASPSSSKKDRA